MTPEMLIAIATLCTSIGAVIIGVRNAGRINDVHVQINSRMDQLLQITDDAALARGIAGERMRAETQRQEDAQ